MLRLAFFTIGLAALGSDFAQVTAASTPASSDVPALSSELSSYVTLIGGVLTGVATLLGIPIVRLNQRKTRAEIAKLELEAAELREKISAAGNSQRKPGEGIRVFIEHSPNTTVHVLADPRFLAPLLLLLDFVFAWVALTLADYFLSILSLGLLHKVALTALALTLLVPIGKQALHVRTILRPQRSEDEIRSGIRQAESIFYALYFVVFASSLAMSILLFTIDPKSLTGAGRILAWFLAAWATCLAVAFPFARRQVTCYLERQIHQHDRMTDT